MIAASPSPVSGKVADNGSSVAAVKQANFGPRRHRDGGVCGAINSRMFKPGRTMAR